MNWFDAVLLILWAMGLLILIGLGRKLEAKLDTILTLIRAITGPATTTPPSIRGRDVPPPPEEKTVYHLTAEHDAKLLGEDAE